MWMLALRIVEKLLILYFGLYLLFDIAMYIYAALVFLFGKKKPFPPQKGVYEKISVIIPAYNEEVSIEACLVSMKNLDYPDYEIIVVNDGSTDGTLEKLKEITDLEPLPSLTGAQLHTAPVKKVWKDKNFPLKIIDKTNGGKADAINAGINFSEGKYICTVDADSVLDRDALKYVVRPFVENPATIVSGGQLAVLNDAEIRDNRLVNARMPRNVWVQWQITEYIKSFLISRMAFSRINALLIMSGAFSVFKKKDLLEAGGFLHPRNDHPVPGKYVGPGLHTVCEDMEIVVRLWRFARDNKRKARAAFVPEAVCWTEVPDRPRNLFKQRSRWHRGLGETLYFHKTMIFDPKYGATGLVAMPYYLFFEFLSPVVKTAALIFLLAAARYDLINTGWIVLLIIAIILTSAVIMASLTVIIEQRSKHARASRDALRYKNFRDWLLLIFYGILSEFSYAFFRIAAQWDGIIRLLKGDKDWHKFERKGVHIIKNENKQ